MSCVVRPSGASVSLMTGSRYSISLRSCSRRVANCLYETIATSLTVSPVRFGARCPAARFSRSHKLPVRLEGHVWLVQRLDVVDVGEGEVPLLLGDPVRLYAHAHPHLVDRDPGHEHRRRGVGAVEAHLTRDVGKVDGAVREVDVDGREGHQRPGVLEVYRLGEGLAAH